ncbi:MULTISPECIES: alpha/beta fold hydrolase [Nocardiopsis]|uniref:Alpha/beta hydrolase n=1 Tax=Nocardiopsis lambiniae TaxID=3075539 RepID=A0ABU2M2M4_9ACTN|nr:MULTISPECIES: alpha/beta hydrolase [unclassified Nocardiopsis]MDE3725097.1 alpha/beta hydrolase [Nocardiopsis sp. N85]MDT0326844.1 alpha/beta hydrolase [Nocardiopsis sp. DSM 44743]
MDPTRIAFEGGGTGRPLVLLHGLGDRRQSWSAVVPRLTEDYRVFCVDLPGFGRTPAPPPGEPYDVFTMTEAVEAFCRLHQLENPHLAGNSLGGSIALELGARGLAGSVTVFSPAGFSGDLGRWGLRTVGTFANLAARVPMPLKERLASTPPARALARTVLRGDPSSPEAKATRFSVRGLQEGAPFIRMIPHIAEYDFEAGPIDCPVTIAWGDRDRTLLPSSAEHAHRRVPGARMVSLLGSGHIPMADDPISVAEHIKWTCRAADLGHRRAVRSASRPH